MLLSIITLLVFGVRVETVVTSAVSIITIIIPHHRTAAQGTAVDICGIVDPIVDLVADPREEPESLGQWVFGDLPENMYVMRAATITRPQPITDVRSRTSPRKT